MYIERPSCLGCCPFVTSVFQLFLQSKHFSWLPDRPATQERLTTMPKKKYPWIRDGKKKYPWISDGARTAIEASWAMNLMVWHEWMG